MNRWGVVGGQLSPAMLRSSSEALREVGGAPAKEETTGKLSQF
jgi:hypothetical protein